MKTPSVPVVVIGLGGGALALWVLSRLAGGYVGVWTESGGTKLSKEANTAIILTLFRAAGLPEVIGKAAVVNAYAESALDNTAVGDGGKSIGLFQLASFGAGKGMSNAERFDPAKNTARIIQEVMSSWGDDLRAKAQAGASVADLAAIFSRDIERPLDASGAMARRRELAARFYPGE